MHACCRTCFTRLDRHVQSCSVTHVILVPATQCMFSLGVIGTHPLLPCIDTNADRPRLVRDGDGLSTLLCPRLPSRRMTPANPSMTLCARRTRLNPPKLLALAMASVSSAGGVDRVASCCFLVMGSTSPLGSIRMCPARYNPPVHSVSCCSIRGSKGGYALERTDVTSDDISHIYLLGLTPVRALLDTRRSLL